MKTFLEKRPFSEKILYSLENIKTFSSENILCPGSHLV